MAERRGPERGTGGQEHGDARRSPDPVAAVVDPSARVVYRGAGLEDGAVLWSARPPMAPLEMLTAWYAEAAADARIAEPGAVVLATADADGFPDARTVLLKEMGAEGLVVYTGYRSAKGHQLEANPRAALVLPWHAASRQVRVRGLVERVSRAESERYFAQRPRGSQLAAWASEQSQPVASRAELERQVRAVEDRFGEGPVPLPPSWGGYRVRPTAVELWAGQASRLHDRALWTSRDGAPARLDDPDAWDLRRLQP